MLTVTTHNIDHGGQDTARGPGDQHRWDRALGLAAVFRGLPNWVGLIQEGFLWHRLGRARVYAEATGTSFYRAEGRNDLDLLAFVSPSVRVLDVKANPRHLKAPALILTVRVDGDSHDTIIATSHLDPWSADIRCQQVRAINSMLRDRHVLLGLDSNGIGPHDPEPDLSLLPDWQLDCHTHLADETRRWDRRHNQLAQHAGWVDVAYQTGQHTTPTGGFGQPFPPVRFDQFWASPHLAPRVTDYRVQDTADFRAISDHVPVTVTIEPA